MAILIRFRDALYRSGLLCLAKDLMHRRWAALLGILVLSCVPRSQSRVPDVAPSSTLGVTPNETSQPAHFAVGHVAPQGPTVGDPAVFVLFNRPVRSLGPEQFVPEGLRIEPAVPGHWEWIGAHGVSFVPRAGRLPRATSFSVTVPASIRSASGEQLERETTFDFQTPLPRVLRATPSRFNRSVEPQTPIVMQLSQPVDLNSLRETVRVFAGDDAIPVQVSAGKTSEEIQIRATEGWPLDSTIRFEVSPGWKGQEGTLPASVPFEGSFETYGPLTARVECRRNETGHCLPEGGLSLQLSNPVHALSLSKSIRGQGVSLNVDRDWTPEARTRSIDLGVKLVPRQKFSVVVDPIFDIYGQPLKWVKYRQVEVADYAPSVRIGFSGDAFLPSQSQVFVHARNSSYEMVVAPLSIEELTELTRLSSQQRFEELAKTSAAMRRELPLGSLNRWEKQTIRLDEVTEHGPFAIGVRYRVGGRLRHDVRWGQRTDLGLTVKMGRDQAHVWVTRLTTGHPVSGAVVSTLGRPGTVSTSVEGLAALPVGQFVSHAEQPGKPSWMVVRSGDERAYRSSDQRVDAWRIPVETDFWGKQRDLAMLFVERDLFRPGQSAWVKGYVRRPSRSGNQVVQGERLALLLISPSGEEIQRIPVTTTRHGGVSARLRIPTSAELGYFSVHLQRDKELLAQATVRVAEYRPMEFEVDVKPQSNSVIAGEPTSFSVAGTFLFGGAMKGAKVETTLRRENSWFSPPGWSDFVTEDSPWQNLEPYRPYSVFLERQEGKLSEHGMLRSEVSSKLEGQVGPERLEFEATVMDVAAQTVSARGSTIVHPAAYYPALQRFDSILVDAPSTVVPKVLALSPEGQALSGKEITLALYRVRWTHAKHQGSEEASSTSSTPVKDLLQRCSLYSASEPRGCELSIPHSGSYIVRATSVDAKGRSVSSSLDFYGIGGGRSAAFRDFDERGQVTLTPDRDSYRVGQRARVLVQSPFERAWAWVTIERNGVMDQRVQQLRGPSPTLDVPIEPDMSPNVHLSIHLLEDREALGAKAHRVADSYRFGYTTLRLDPEEHRLHVEIKTDQSSYRPRDDVELNLSVKNAAGRGGRHEVAVFVIDEGVLGLTGYEMPDPLSTFLSPQPLRVETIESRESTARVFGVEPNENENKGDPGGGGDGERSNMLTAAYFNPSVMTEQNGRAKVEFPLPDNIGRFRVMAVAVSSDDDYGTGRASITVNQPLMVRPALPRFLRAGDSFEAAVALSGLDFRGGRVNVEAAFSGLELLSSSQNEVSLEKNGTSLVTFEARADEVGTSNLLFSARGAGQKDAVRVRRRVQSPTQLEAVALYGNTEAAEAHRLGALHEVRKDMGRLDVTLSSSALVGLEGGFEQLWDYPYSCSEQLASRALPLLALRDLAASYGVSIPDDADVRIGESVGHLIRRQRGDGGFGMWPESPESHPWVSSYALWVLRIANQRGVEVPASVFERGVRYLRDLAAQRARDDLTEAVFATFVLGRLGYTDPGSIAALFERSAELSATAQILLSWASSDANLSQVERKLVQRIEGMITLRGNRAELSMPHEQAEGGMMSSPVRRHALALLALLASYPEHRLAAPLVRGLLDARDGQGWNSTQESAFALLALDAYRSAQERNEPDFFASVFLGRTLLGEKRFFGRSTRAEEFTVELKDLVAQGDLTFAKRGAGRLYYEARLSYARSNLPEHELERGFAVSKTMTVVPADFRGATPTISDQNRLTREDLVLMQVVVVVPTHRRFVVIEDPLPAGLEAIDPGLAVSSQSFSELLSGGSDGYSSAWHRSELRDDRVLYFVDDMPPGVYRYRYLARATIAGRFVTPPTRVMEMYQPEVYGRTGARIVEVVRARSEATQAEQ